MSGRALPAAEHPPHALLQALRLLLRPVARLCLGRGVPYAAAEEVLRRAFVEAARELHDTELRASPNVSRLSAATGLSRREVTRIVGEELPPAQVVRSSPATQVFTRWAGSPSLHDGAGRPVALKRSGAAPSFEALAQSVTRDVHPRSLLEELCRLGLARHDTASDTVHVVQDGFVPREDEARLFSFLGSNVGDHLAGAVDNVLSDPPRHMEQAIFADELSAASLASVRKLLNAQWRAMLAALVPELEALVEADRQAGVEARERLRVGLYSYHTTMSDGRRESRDG